MKILILDAGWNQSIYLIGELSRAGIETTVAAPRVPDPRGLGRYCREIESPAIEHSSYAAFVEQLMQTESFDVVFPACEPAQQIAWALPEKYSRRVFPFTTPRQRELLADRGALYRLVDSLEIPIPRDVLIPDAAELERAIAPLGFPCVLRGTQGMSGEQVMICGDLQQAQAAYRRLRARSPGPPFAQQFLDGQRCLIGGLFDHGRMLQCFSQVTVESCPSPTGPSVRVRSHKDPVLTAYAEQIFRNLEWDGLACAEFIRLGPGDYRFLEINPRPWAAIYAAHVCGVPLLKMFVQYVLGRYSARRIEFADGIECTLFPAFFTARIRAGAFPRAADLKAYWQALRTAPWGYPPLMRSFVRLIWWTYDAQRAARQGLAR